MTPAADSAASDSQDIASRLRNIPSIHDLLDEPAIAALVERAGREVVTQAARSVLDQLRADLKNSRASSAVPTDAGTLTARISAAVEAQLAPSLRHIINATGVILHTNLGRAPLSREAIAQITETAAHYSNLEYSIKRGERGRRDVHIAALLAEVVGTDAAIVVNNNAAAVFLVLHTLAKGFEVVVSRGELIEIGDGFRIPEIMSESGAFLREVGTTNRTRIRDYERAINERTRLLLRVHPSNFRITGFTERASLDDLIALGCRKQIPVYEDLGSGCLVNLAASGVDEPVVRASCHAGVSVVSFSGDKLLGGPQAGIIAGRGEIIEQIRRNPLFRVLRVDKLTLAALEATLHSYRRGALDEIPSLRMIHLSADELSGRALRLCEQLRSQLPRDGSVELREGFSVIGGGSTPNQKLPAHLVAIASLRHSAAAIEERLRQPENGTPVIARIEEGCVVLDLRTVFPEEESALASTLAAALR